MRNKVNPTFSFEIPDVHPSLNKWTRMHWTKRNAENSYWKNMVWALAKEAKIPTFKEPVEIFITYVHPRTNVDLDNYTPKWIIDGLKSFFIDDNIMHLKKLGWRFVKGKVKKSIVEIKVYKEEDLPDV